MSITSIGNRTITYANNGNITAISGVGTMAYTNSSKPYQQTSFTPDTGVTPGDYNVTYTSFDRPHTISTSDVTLAAFTYNAAGERVKMEVNYDSDPVITRYYIGGRYEFDVTEDETVERLYLGGDAYSAPVVLQNVESGGWTFYNIGRDYLGSITHITTDDGVLVAEYSYDPWGRLRNPATLEIYQPGYEPDLLLGRGFTGHEHLPWFGLINMNARLYDPLLGRFLQPDPYVQDPDGTQNFNRYSYALNNPLRYTDESGEFIFSMFMGPLGMVLDAVCWGALSGTLMAKNAHAQGLSEWAFYISAGIGVSLISGGWGMGISNLVTTVSRLSGFLGGALAGAAGGAVGGAVSGFYYGSLPSGYSFRTDGTVCCGPDDNSIHYGACIKTSLRSYTAYVFETACCSKQQLYLTLGHEYFHAFLWNIGLQGEVVHHEIIYDWQVKQAFKWNYNYQEQLRTYNKYHDIGKYGFEGYQYMGLNNFFPILTAWYVL